MNFRIPYRRTSEILLVCVLILFSLWVGWTHIGDHNNRLVPDSQNLLSLMPQSILFAAGHGMGRVACADGEFPELEQFLAGEISEIPAAAYPAHCSREYIADPFLKMHYYLFYYVGWSFRLFGISARSFHLACLVLFVLSVLASYCLFRVAAGPLFAAAGALLIASSPAFLIMMPSLRDFGKTPFVIFALFLMVALMRERLSIRRLVCFSAVLGAVIGIGYGFRQDLIVCLPAALFIVLIGTQTTNQRFVRARIVAALSLCAAFALAALPVFQTDRAATGATSAHTLIQGSMRQPEDNLGLHGIDYDFGYKTLDPHIIAAINAYALRAGLDYPAAYMTAAYGDSGKAMFLDIARTFPADIFKRGLVAVINLGGILDDDYLSRADMPDGNAGDLRAPIIRRLYEMQRPLAQHLSKFGFLYGLCALGIIAAVSYRKACFAVLLLFYFGAYPNLLYEFRHYFQTVVLFIFLMGVVVAALAHSARIVLRGVRRRDGSLREAIVRSIRSAGKGCVFLFLLLSAIIATIVPLDAVQRTHVKRMIALYDDALLTPVPITLIHDGESVTVQLDAPARLVNDGAELENSRVAPACLAIRFKDTRRAITFDLLNSNPAFERPCSVVLRGDGVYFFPVYDFGWEPPARFRGITMKHWDYDHVEGIYVAHLPQELRLWPYLHIPEERDAFLPMKTTALDALWHVVKIEVAAAFRFGNMNAAQRYQEAIWKFRHHDFFVARALAHALGNAGIAGQAAIWRNIGAYAEPQRDRASQWFAEQADEAASKEQYDLAVHLARMGIDIAPYDLRHWQRLAAVYEAQGNMDAYRDAYYAMVRQLPESEEIAQQAKGMFPLTSELEADDTLFRALSDWRPDMVTPLLYLGGLFERMEYYEAAAKVYQDILTRQPEHSQALYRLGVLCILDGNLDAGKAMVHAAAQKDANLAGEIANRCGEVASHFSEQAKYALAAELYGLALKIAPNNLWHQVGLGDIAALQGNVEEAVSAYVSVLMQAPESPVTADKLTALMRHGIRDGAQNLDTWAQIVERHPGAVVPRLHLGLALEEQGDIDGAIAAYSQVLSVQSDCAAAAARLQRMREQKQ